MEMMIVELPAHHKALAQALQQASAELLQTEARLEGGRSVDLVGVEGQMAEAAARLERAMARHVLAELDVDAPFVTIGGKKHKRVGRYEQTYYTLAGPVAVLRSIYRAVGERNEKTVDPISVRGGLVDDRWLPATARAMAQRIAIGTSREAEQISALERRLPYSRTSFEHVAHAVGEHVVLAHDDIEQALAEQMEIPRGTASIGIALDRASMAFEEPRARPVGRPRKDAPKRPIARVFHMAWSGTVTCHDRQGTVLHTIHYGREPTQGQMLVQTLVSDALTLRLRRPGLPIVVLGDGAHELWNLLESALDGVADVTFTVDFWHLAEKLAAAAAIVHSSDASQTRTRWTLDLLNRDGAAERIADELRQSGLEYSRSGKHAPVHEALTYLDNHAARMRYLDNKRRGLPIGSGPVEANAKSIYFVRMKRPGARWKPETAEHVLHLRAHMLSQRFPDALNLALPKPRVVRIAA